MRELKILLYWITFVIMYIAQTISMILFVGMLLSVFIDVPGSIIIMGVMMPSGGMMIIIGIHYSVKAWAYNTKNIVPPLLWVVGGMIWFVVLISGAPTLLYHDVCNILNTIL